MILCNRHVPTLVIAWGGSGGGGRGGGGNNVLDSTLLIVHVQEVTYVLLRCALFVDLVRRSHVWPCKDTRQWLAQPTVVLRSISICIAKEECRQELVPAFGRGTEKWGMTEIVDQQKRLWR